MKILLAAILLLIGMIGWGQEAKLNSWYEYSYFWNDTANYVLYSYDSVDKLKSVYYTQQVSIPRTATYSNDTLIRYFNGFGSNEYYYSIDDTIMSINNSQGNTDTSYFKINENNEVVESGGVVWNWEDGNCLEQISWGEDTNWIREYHSYYINPWFEENKYLRMHQKTGTFSGSHNLWSHDYQVGELVVIESIGPYPTVIEYYGSGNLLSTYYFDYKYVITDTPKLPEESATVLSIDYFDMLGRKVSKPKKGFYIERKTTDKGIISTKNYIR